MSFWHKGRTKAPQEDLIQPVDLFTGDIDRRYSPHYGDDQGMRVYYPNIGLIWDWSQHVTAGVASGFVESRRLYPDWYGGSRDDIRHPFIQFYIRPVPGTPVCGLSKLDSDLPDDGGDWSAHPLGLVRGRIAVKEGDAVLDGRTLTLTGSVMVTYTLWNEAFGVRYFNNVVIGALETEGSLEFS